MLKEWMKGYPKKLQRQMMLADGFWKLSQKENTDIFVVLQAVLELRGLGITDRDILKQKFREILDMEKALFTADPNAYYARLEGRLDEMLAARG